MSKKKGSNKIRSPIFQLYFSHYETYWMSLITSFRKLMARSDFLLFEKIVKRYTGDEKNLRYRI